MARADHIGWLHHGGRNTRWGNFGLWTDGARPDDYPAACAALARAVGQAAGMQDGDSVLSLACGAGEELALWAEGFGAAAVMGLELTPSLAAQARRRAEAIHTGCEIEVHCADARRLPELVSGRFDRIVCVDGAYHLGPHLPLLRAARTRLFAGGGFAYTDFVLDAHKAGTAAWRRAALRVGAGLSGVAFAEVRDSHAALDQLREAGFDEVRAMRLDSTVLDGFCAFAARQARRIGPAARASLAWRRVATTAWLIRVGRSAGLGYVLYTGRVAAAAETFDAPDVPEVPDVADVLDRKAARATPNRPGAFGPSTPAPARAAAAVAASEASIAPTTPSAERTALSSKGMPGRA